MSEKQEYPSLLKQGKNLAKFTLNLVKYIHENQGKGLFVSDETFNKRLDICKTCDKYDEMQQRCVECGCFLNEKATLSFEKCPLGKWEEDFENWENNLENIAKEISESKDLT
jgi:hypothetical protein